MTPSTAFAPVLPTIGGILVAMGLVAALEVALPLQARSRWSRVHLLPNLALTGIAFATNAVLGAALLAVTVPLRARGFGLLGALSLPPLLEGAIAVAMLDLWFYAAHRLMHAMPGWWRYHAVHHSDPAVDVTTTIRQHPVESGIRYGFLAAVSLVLCPSPAAFAVYRSLSALNGLLEHGNFRIPAGLDRLLSLITTWPNLHKIHHSRIATQTDTNYGNLFSWWDRLFGTFTPSAAGTTVAYGLDGFDAPSAQTTTGLLAMPWHEAHPRRPPAFPSRGIRSPGSRQTGAIRS